MKEMLQYLFLKVGSKYNKYNYLVIKETEANRANLMNPQPKPKIIKNINFYHKMSI